MEQPERLLGMTVIAHACRTKTKYMRIDGSVKTNTRQALVNDFQNNRDLRAAVLSIQAAGTGLTLTVCLLCLRPPALCLHLKGDAVAWEQQS